MAVVMSELTRDGELKLACAHPQPRFAVSLPRTGKGSR